MKCSRIQLPVPLSLWKPTPLHQTPLRAVFSEGWISGYFRALKIENLFHFYFAAREAIDFTNVYCGMKRISELRADLWQETYQREEHLLKESKSASEDGLHNVSMSWLRFCHNDPKPGIETKQKYSFQYFHVCTFVHLHQMAFLCKNLGLCSVIKKGRKR